MQAIKSSPFYRMCCFTPVPAACQQMSCSNRCNFLQLIQKLYSIPSSSMSMHTRSTLVGV